MGRRQRATDLRAGLLERCAAWQLLVIGSEPETEPVAGKARKNVEVHVKHFLHRGCSVGEEEVDPFAADAAAANRGGDPLALLHKASRRRRVEVGKIRSV